MIHISLFSGIGGADLAAEWAGWSNLVSCEINPFGRKILEYYWPGAYHHDDIHTLTYEKINHELIQRFGTNWRSEPVILTGGFPCQPFSMAGKRKGTEDDRHLWPEMLRLIREIQPEWIVGENVLGFVNWDDGMVFDQVLSDLETEGYETQAYVLPAVSVNAPHRRDRVCIVASRNAADTIGIRYGRRAETTGSDKPESIWWMDEDSGRNWSKIRRETSGYSRDASDPSNPGLQGIELRRTPEQGETRQQTFGSTTKLHQIPDWRNFPTQSPVRCRNDGLPGGLDSITFSKWRNESIKGYGNAWVPQVALQIFKAINKYERNRVKL